MIGAEELAGSGAGDVLALIETARPHWLARAGRERLEVYHGPSRLSGVLELRAFRPAEMETVEYLTPAQAAFRFPGAGGGPAIVLHPRRSARPPRRVRTRTPGAFRSRPANSPPPSDRCDSA